MELSKRHGTQADADSDGFGDNPNGTTAVHRRHLRWSDTDGDGYSNQQGDMLRERPAAVVGQRR